MSRGSRNILLFLISTFLCLGILVVGLLTYRYLNNQPLLPEQVTGRVLGKTAVVSPLFDTVTPAAAVAAATVTPKQPQQQSIPKTVAPDAPPTVTFVDMPQQVMEGDLMTFTWFVDGTPQDIHTTTVYYGVERTPGTLNHAVSPENTTYSQSLHDFISGTYRIPLRFVESVRAPSPGTYYARVYALVNGQHIWSAEREFTVAVRPVSRIRLVNFPTTVKQGENAAFTWEITGPSATTGFTAVVGGQISKPGSLGDTVDLPQTPYTVITPDFTHGTYNVPLRFVGNIRFTSAGTYYFRAMAFVDGRNIWTDEHSLTVE